MVEQRDKNGRFKPGWGGGPGRPRRQVEEAYLAVLGEACSEDEWRRICERAVADARAGDGAARSWLSKYLLPNEAVTVQVSDDAEIVLEELRTERQAIMQDKPFLDFLRERAIAEDAGGRSDDE